ncbi:hypothetical protein ACIA48_01180 [Mycobacterium sp. NPDC051804]|uniref:hypothetical protein n=1 Tax=Mycobacterium sp. NPDC051804 TaxID=3364295 RepID=UPI00378F6D43
MLTGRDDLLTNVTTYGWDDGGTAAGARFTWISQQDNDANQAAAALANFLMSNHTKLAALDSGFLGLTKVSAAQLNPQLVRSYATALAPHLGELVGGRQSAFDSLRAQVADDPLALRNLLSVFVADPEAGRTAVEATHASAEQYEEAAAADPPDSDESVAALKAAGSLLGAAYGAVELANSDIPTPSSGQATSEMAVRIAAILVPADPNPAIVSKYVQDGRLMSPTEVEKQFSSTAMRTYYLDLQNYIGTKGFEDGHNAFFAAFKDSSGVPLG